MDDAIKAMDHVRRAAERKNANKGIEGEGQAELLVVENMCQKLEADVRGHIKLELEMKVHIDYLENKVENMLDKVNSIDAMQDRM